MQKEGWGVKIVYFDIDVPKCLQLVFIHNKILFF